MSEIAIVGAGLAGLTAAYALRDEGNVTVFEASDRIGGKLHTVPFKQGPVDMGAEAFLAARRDAADFFTSLGVELVGPSGLKPLLYSDGLKQLPRQTYMGLPARGEVVAELVSAETVQRIDAEPEAGDFDYDRSVGEVVAERFGADLVHSLIDALLGGVYSARAHDLGLRDTLPAIAEVLDSQPPAQRSLARAVQTLLDRRGERTPGSHIFASFKGGYAEVYETLAEKSGATIYVDAFISGLKKVKGGYQLTGAEGTFDRVVLAVPAPSAAGLLQGIPEAAEAVSLLRGIRLASSAVVGMKFADATGLPEASGILVDSEAADVAAKAFTFSSKKWPHLGERGGALVRASFGRLGDEAITREDEEVLVDKALDDLQTITGFDGRAAGLDEIYVQRWYGGLPQFAPGHRDVVDKIQATLAGIDGIDAIGAWSTGVGVPDVIAGALALASEN